VVARAIRRSFHGSVLATALCPWEEFELCCSSDRWQDLSIDVQLSLVRSEEVQI